MKRLTDKDYDDAADLVEQGASQAESADSESHTTAGRNYAVKIMNEMALKLTAKAMAIRSKKIKPKPL